jgi:hypothetical protein
MIFIVWLILSFYTFSDWMLTNKLCSVVKLSDSIALSIFSLVVIPTNLGAIS